MTKSAASSQYPTHTNAERERERESRAESRENEGGSESARHLAKPAQIEKRTYRNPGNPAIQNGHPTKPQRSTAKSNGNPQFRLEIGNAQRPRCTEADPRPPTAEQNRPSRPTPRLPNYRKFTRTPPKSNKFKWN